MISSLWLAQPIRIRDDLQAHTHVRPDDPVERARIAAIVRGDGERLRSALFALREALHRVARGKADQVGEAALDYAQAEALIDWIDAECGELLER